MISCQIGPEREVPMSWLPTTEPVRVTGERGNLAMVIEGRPRDLGGFSVQRVLPARERRAVGPFVFFDHFGPMTLPPGVGMDVRPHPHIGLATVTYLFEGEMIHRDSLGSHQVIRAGEVNWMTAGRGIVHSERSTAPERALGARGHGLQLWVALPLAHEETAPAFTHHERQSLPSLPAPGLERRLIAGTAWGVTSPVPTLSPLFYVDVAMTAGSAVVLPDEHQERAAYVTEGSVHCDDQRIAVGQMAVFEPSARVVLEADAAARVMLLGGAPLDGERHIWWNFVASSRERIEQAKRDWKLGRFARIPGDDVELMPLPE
jgi:redox-sensitive bicupin YhaK (pirin superfamily)